MKTLGERIRELREERDLSLREFAGKLKLSAAFVSDVELGRRFPSDKVLADMATVLKTTNEELRNHDTRPPVEDMKRITTSNPAYGLAFRRIIDEKVSPEELMKWADRKSGEGKKKQ
jgi:transcriptional regulator with XRE-family HTH domain